MYQQDIGAHRVCIGPISAVLTDVGVGVTVAPMEVRVLGALTLDDGRIPLAPRDRAVMAALTVRLGAPLSAASLAAALWGDGPPPSWSHIVPGCIMRLRRLIAPAQIETTPHGYRLVPEHVEVDAERFETTRRAGYAATGVG